MAKSAIYLLNNTTNEVKDGQTIPLGTILRRYGQAVKQDGNAISLCCPGYYKVDVIANIEPATAVGYKVKLQKDGIDVIGGVAEINPAVAATVLPFPISVLVRNTCAGASSLSVQLEGGDAKIINMTTVVEKL